MINAEWCAWCNRSLRGKKSWFYRLCSKCRNSKEGKEYINWLERKKEFNKNVL